MTKNNRKMSVSEAIRALARKKCAALKTTVKTTEGDTITMQGMPQSGEYTGESLVKLAEAQTEPGKLRVKPEGATASATSSGSILPSDMPLFVGLACGTVATDSADVVMLLTDAAEPENVQPSEPLTPTANAEPSTNGTGKKPRQGNRIPANAN